MPHQTAFHQRLHCLLRKKSIIREINTAFFEISNRDPSIYYLVCIVS